MADPKRLKLVYISPAFPWRSLVFEQNELMGLLQTGTPMRVFSCRKTDSKKEMNRFAEPLAAVTQYFQWQDALAGLASSLLRHPLSLFWVMCLTLWGCLNPFFAPRVIGAFLCSLCLYRTARNEGDWIHADFGGNSATVAMFFSILTGKPFSYKVHAYDIYSRSIFIRDPLRRVKARAARIVLAEHQDGKTAYCGVAGISHDKVLVHYSCVRTDVFQPVGNGEGNRQVLALGRFVAKKGFDKLLHAVSALKTEGCAFRLKIYGYGPEKSVLENIIESLNLKDSVELCEAYDNDELVAIFAESCLLVIPSVIDKDGDRDGVPTVIYEAMACGVPIISSAIAGIPEVVKNERNGLLVRPGDVQELAGAIKRMLASESFRGQLGRQARGDVVERYDYRIAAKGMCSAFALYLPSKAQANLT